MEILNGKVKHLSGSHLSKDTMNRKEFQKNKDLPVMLLFKPSTEKNLT